MNYDVQITTLVEAIKADRSIIQPWRNKAVARLEEAQAFVRMGLSTSSLKTDSRPSYVAQDASLGGGSTCICVEGAVDRDCPEHGGK